MRSVEHTVIKSPPPIGCRAHSPSHRQESSKRLTGTAGRMGLVLLLLILALLFGGLGLFVEGLKWALIIAVVLLIASAISGALGGRRV